MERGRHTGCRKHPPDVLQASGRIAAESKCPDLVQPERGPKDADKTLEQNRAGENLLRERFLRLLQK